MSKLNKAVQLILKGEPIIVPTDTVYGLVCRYDSKEAVEKIYSLKGRSRKKPLILLGYSWKTLKKFVNVETLYATPLQKMIKKYWPGALTIILPTSKNTPKYLNKEFNTIGIRVPNNKFLLKLLECSPGQVLASTSANISGKKGVKLIAKKVKLFIKAKKCQMSLIPSQIIEIRKKRMLTIR